MTAGFCSYVVFLNYFLELLLFIGKLCLKGKFYYFMGKLIFIFNMDCIFSLTNVYKSKCFIYFAIAFIGNEGPYKVTVVLPTQRLFQCISMGQMDQDQNNFTKEDQIKDNLLYSNKL